MPKQEIQQPAQKIPSTVHSSSAATAATVAIATKPPPGMPDESNKIKLVLVGDTAVGKSCLVTNYLYNSYEEDYEPTVLDVYKGVKNVHKH